MEFRDFNSEAYKRWRIGVFKRDFFRCRLCSSGEALQAHHIRRWADCIELRFVVNNGITLCNICHTLVKDKEDEYAALFTKLVQQKPKTKSDRDGFLRARQALRKK